MPRLALLCLLSLAALSSAPARAAADTDSCRVTVGPDDVVAKSGDVVIEAGRKVENAIALKGSVTVKKGATVRSAIAVRGDVVVEKGATVEESVITIEGKAKVEGTVKGSRISARGDEVEIIGEDGERLSFGSALARKILSQVLSKIDGCALLPEPKK
jgi:NDP-sugar pyrophosphorylase family protein